MNVVVMGSFVLTRVLSMCSRVVMIGSSSGGVRWWRWTEARSGGVVVGWGGGCSHSWEASCSVIISSIIDGSTIDGSGAT